MMFFRRRKRGAAESRLLGKVIVAMREAKDEAREACPDNDMFFRGYEAAITTLKEIKEQLDDDHSK